MKLKNICIAVVALALAAGMTACGGTSATAASSTSEAASVSTTAVSELPLRLHLPRLLPLRPLSARLLLLRLLPPLLPEFNAHSVHNKIAKSPLHKITCSGLFA